MSKSAFDAEFSVGPLGDELNLVDLESVKKLIQLLTNALKSLLIYPKNNPLPKEFKRKLYQGLSEFLDSRDELNLSVESSQILFEGKVVHEDGEREEGMAYLLHKDGVREMAFLKGVEQTEIDDFIEVLEICSISKDLEEDLVTMLWEKDFNHIKYLVVDDLLDVDIPSPEDIPNNWDFNRLFYSEIALAEQKTSSDRIDRSELSYQYKEDQTRELLRKLKEFSPEEMGNIQSLLEMDDRTRSLDEFLNILTEILIVEQNFPEFSQMMETQEKILDALITIADFPSATKVVGRWKKFEEMMQKSSAQKDPLKQKKAEKTRQIVNGAGEEGKIKKITQILNEKENVDLLSVREYLRSLNWNSIAPILHMLQELKDFSVRKIVCEVLTEKGRNHLELLKEGITDQRWYVVRNVVWILGKIGSEEGIRYLKPLIHHPDLRVRKGVITSLIEIPGTKAGALLVSFLEDEEKGLRILASRGLAKRKEREALPALTAILREDQFKVKSPEEKKSMLESFASVGEAEAVPFLVKMINKRSWLKRDKHNETRIFAIGALSLIDALEAKDALIQLGKKRNKVIRQACQNALRRIDYRTMRETDK
jgi:hypothetical protein